MGDTDDGTLVTVDEIYCMTLGEIKAVLLFLTELADAGYTEYLRLYHHFATVDEAEVSDFHWSLFKFHNFTDSWGLPPKILAIFKAGIVCLEGKWQINQAFAKQYLETASA